MKTTPIEETLARMQALAIDSRHDPALQGWIARNLRGPRAWAELVQTMLRRSWVRAADPADHEFLGVPAAVAAGEVPADADEMCIAMVAILLALRVEARVVAEDYGKGYQHCTVAVRYGEDWLRFDPTYGTSPGDDPGFGAPLVRSLMWEPTSDPVTDRTVARLRKDEALFRACGYFDAAVAMQEIADGFERGQTWFAPGAQASHMMAMAYRVWESEARAAVLAGEVPGG